MKKSTSIKKVKSMKFKPYKGPAKISLFFKRFTQRKIKSIPRFPRLFNEKNMASKVQTK